MNKFFKLIILKITFSFVFVVTNANCSPISIEGRTAGLVTTSKVRLSDIANISAESRKEDEAVIGLNKIELIDSPQPGESVVLSAFEVIEKLKSQGVNIDQVKYSFPRVITIKRASRKLEDYEVRKALNDYISKSNIKSELVSIDNFGDAQVPSGTTALTVLSSNQAGNGKRSFGLNISNTDGWSKDFTITARVNEFKEVPVAKRGLTKGALITSSDFVLARLNLDAIPADSVNEIEDVVGFEATREINTGEVLRLQKITPPIVVESGSAVTMKYESGLFEATATGIALQSGGIGQEIKVKNEASKKIIVGKISQAGLVVVK